MLLSKIQRANDGEIRILPFVHTYNPRNGNINSIIHQLNNVLREDEQTKSIYESCRFINSKRQSKNLKRILCSSQFEDPNYSVTKCMDQRCGTCNYITEGSTYNFSGRNFRINTNMSCDTRDVIYVITCPWCNEYYIGETSNTLRSRVRVHRQQINTPEYRQIQLSAHLETSGNFSLL